MRKCQPPNLASASSNWREGSAPARASGKGEEKTPRAAFWAMRRPRDFDKNIFLPTGLFIFKKETSSKTRTPTRAAAGSLNVFSSALSAIDSLN